MVGARHPSISAHTRGPRRVDALGAPWRVGRRAVAARVAMTWQAAAATGRARRDAGATACDGARDADGRGQRHRGELAVAARGTEKVVPAQPRGSDWRLRDEASARPA